MYIDRSKVLYDFLQKKSIKLLPSETKLLMIFSCRSNDNENTKNKIVKYLEKTRKDYYSCIDAKYHVNIVEVIIKGDLNIVLKGTKKALLEHCVCYIPMLDINTKSLNHAYTVISESIEQLRTSHTGNVFEATYYCINNNNKEWNKLNNIRDQKQYEYENQLSSDHDNQDDLFDT